MIQGYLAFALSTLGIYPRYIEPYLLRTTYLDLPLSPDLEGLRIVHFSDLHFHRGMSSRFLRKITSRIRRERPDLILATGDFLCYSQLEDSERLKAFLCTLQAPLGCYCSLGNHDYDAYVSRNSEGNYDVVTPPNFMEGAFRAFKALIQKRKRSGEITQKVKSVSLNAQFCALLKETPFSLLENSSITLPIGLNLVGLGDYSLDRCRPETGFAGYNKKFPGIVLTHNPDSVPLLQSYPGQLVLSGHTHGEQIHFPFPKALRKLSQKLARLENSEYTRGFFSVGDKKLYVNRGLGSHRPFRFCSPPEILVVRVKENADR
ncbi:MAG: 3',5'-cyclic adenosine monophosphate phosphodiesterase CpdA [Chlamydiae bacterium]|nr:3',5'-cyclic adenosine monophosphate phosphodiesterase CpdA [Chlamydiota bacterium]